MTASTLLARYRTAFVAGDLAALLDCFAYPVQSIASTPDGTSIASMPRGDWSHALTRILGAYARLGVADAVAFDQVEAELLPGIATIRLRWGLRDAEGATIYEFLAAYTISEVDGASRIVSIAQDEGPKLRQALHNLN